MSKFRDNLLLTVVLTTSSALVYFILLIIFRKPYETYFYLLQDMAFVPFQALIGNFNY